MSNAFQDMIAELYQEEDFVEYCYIEGRQYKCFCSSIGDGTLFTDAGMVSEENFVLDLQIRTLDRMPQENDKVQFRNKFYKISHIDTDSANTTIKLYLIDLSKGG